MLGRLTLKSRFMMFLAVLAGLSLVVFGALRNLTASVGLLDDAHVRRTQATALATDFKRLNQTMTRDVMAFVATEQPEFEDSYRQLDAVLHGRAADEQGRTQPMLDRFRQADFTAEEMQRLEAAHTAILALNKVEREAIGTAKGELDDGQGGIQIALPNALLAKVMVFSQQYSDAAGQIGALIDEFDRMQSQRLDGEVRAAVDNNQAAYRLAIAALAALLLCSALALWRLYISIQRPLRQGVALAERLANGELTARLPVSRHDELGSLLHALNGIGDALQHALSDVRQRVTTMTQAAHELSAGNRDLAGHTGAQAEHLNETVATMQTLADTVAQNAEHAALTARLVGETVTHANQSGRIMEDAVQAIQRVRKQADEVAEISQLINHFSFQTNILALNAAVEAARAGEHGRGFAVVAAEVRQLALRSADAARSIDVLVEQSIQGIGAGAARVEEAGNSVSEIISAVQRIHELASDIAAASQEQAGGLNQASVAMDELARITRDSDQLVARAAQATGHQQEQADALADTIAVFRLDAVEEDMPVTPTETDTPRFAPYAEPGHNTPVQAPTWHPSQLGYTTS